MYVFSDLTNRRLLGSNNNRIRSDLIPVIHGEVVSNKWNFYGSHLRFYLDRIADDRGNNLNA